MSSSLPATPVDASRRGAASGDDAAEPARPCTVPITSDAREGPLAEDGHSEEGEGICYPAESDAAPSRHLAEQQEAAVPSGAGQSMKPGVEKDDEEGSGRESSEEEEEDIEWAPQPRAAAASAWGAVRRAEGEPPVLQSTPQRAEPAQRAPRSSGKDITARVSAPAPQYPYDSFDMIFSSAYGPDGACKYVCRMRKYMVCC